MPGRRRGRRGRLCSCFQAMPCSGQSGQGEAELSVAVNGVFYAPDSGDPITGEGEEVDLVHVLEAPARRCVAAPFAQVGGRAGEAPNDPVTLTYELDQLHPQVRKRAAKGSEPLPGEGRRFGCEEHVDELVLASIDRLFEEAPDRVLFAVHSARRYRGAAACSRRPARSSRCSASSGGSWTSKSTPSMATRRASQPRSSSPVRYSQVCSSIGSMVPQYEGTLLQTASAGAWSVTRASYRLGAVDRLSET